MEVSAVARFRLGLFTRETADQGAAHAVLFQGVERPALTRFPLLGKVVNVDMRGPRFSIRGGYIQWIRTGTHSDWNVLHSLCRGLGRLWEDRRRPHYRDLESDRRRRADNLQRMQHSLVSEHVGPFACLEGLKAAVGLLDLETDAALDYHPPSGRIRVGTPSLLGARWLLNNCRRRVVVGDDEFAPALLSAMFRLEIRQPSERFHGGLVGGPLHRFREVKEPRFVEGSAIRGCLA